MDVVREYIVWNVGSLMLMVSHRPGIKVYQREEALLHANIKNKNIERVKSAPRAAHIESLE